MPSLLPARWATALLLGAALTQAGCLLHSQEIARTRHAFERQYPAAQFDRKVAFDLSPLTMAMAGGLTRRWAPETFEEFGPYLRYLHRVEVGVYGVEGLSAPGRVDAARLPVLREGGWETVVRVREPGEHVWVMARPGRQSLGAFYVVVLGEDELVMARVEGDLGRLVEYALETHGDVFDAEAPDTASPDEAPPAAADTSPSALREEAAQK